MAKKKHEKELKKISTIDDLWDSLVVSDEDILEAYNYATVSLPWTFDRMRYGQSTQKSINRRLVNIFIGVLNQTMLERILTDKGYDCSKEWKKYRDSDIFDFQIGKKKYDVKTVVLYSEYNNNSKREPFTKEFLINNKDYSGRIWRQFFPIMVAISQLTINKMKDGYIFGIAECNEDLRKRQPKPNDGGYWCSTPFKKALNFFQNKIVIKEREKANQGFKVKLNWFVEQTTIDDSEDPSEIKLHGEWNGKRLTETKNIEPNENIISNNNFSSLCCIEFKDPWRLSTGKLKITVNNEYNSFIHKITDPTINLNDDDFKWIVDDSSFVNLKIPPDYQIYWLGHISFTEFASTFPNYPSHFIPHPQNMDENQEARVNDRTRKKFRTMDRRREKAINDGIEIPWPEFSSFIEGSKLKAGILSVAMRGPKPIGAACYYYPPYAMQETALYILPSDLYIMDSL